MLNIYDKKNKEKLLKEARESYQNLSKERKDKKQKDSHVTYRNISEEEKDKRHQYGRERYKNLLEDEYIYIYILFFCSVRYKDCLSIKQYIYPR